MVNTKYLYHISTTIRNILNLNPNCRVQVICPKEFHGSIEGGWIINPQGLNKNSVIYSVGVGDDLSFDLSLIEKYKVTVHAFDPTPKSIDWVKEQKLPKNFKIYPWGLAHYDGEATFVPPKNTNFVSFKIVDTRGKDENAISLPVFRLKTIMKKLGHKKINILKMDIEGAEYKVIDDLIKSKIKIDQILVEFHHRFKGFSKKDTEKAVKKLNKNHKIFCISDNGVDYSFKKVLP